MAIRKLTPEIHEKVWGSKLTAPWLANPEGRKIGEIWFSAPEALPVLVKLLFTSDRLSVQVHPDDVYAQSHGGERGKTEMWHILRADAKAKIALGPLERLTEETVRASVVNGDIVDLLRWIPARAGDTFFIPAGTIHAIGSGLAICEVQQHSDLTYRLFDYHRKPERPLHIEDSLAVAQLEPYTLGPEALADCEYFQTARVSVQGAMPFSTASLPAIYIAVAGQGMIAGEPFHAGEAWLIPGGDPEFAIESTDAAFVIASAKA